MLFKIVFCRLLSRFRLTIKTKFNFFNVLKYILILITNYYILSKFFTGGEK